MGTIVAGDLGDCEAPDGGWWEQDANTWSSFAYLAVALFLAGAVTRRRMPVAVVVLVLAVAAEGVGSVLYHGAPGDGAWLLHDVALVGILGYVAGWHLGRLRDDPDRWAVTGAGVSVVAGTLAWQASQSATTPLAGVLLVLIAGAEVHARRRRRPAVWGAGLSALTGAAGALWVLGRSDSPLCTPASWLQPHALWHLASALLVLAWADAAYGRVLAQPPQLLRRATDRTLGTLAWGLGWAFHRSIDVSGRERLPPGRPTLLVANHANGFVDPILVAAVYGRLPRFLAKAALWKVLPARPFLALAGVLPVYRSSDGDRPAENRRTFSATDRELAQGGTIAIFPEGTTGDRGGLDRVRTGAARIAIGALHAAPDLVIVPVGLAYESRIEIRPRASVVIGDPIEVASVVHRPPPQPGEEPDHDDVRALTAAITASLQAIAPDFGTRDDRDVLRAAARTVATVELSRGEPSFGVVDRRARALTVADPEQRRAIMDAYREYATHLHLMGLHDGDLRRPPVSALHLIAAALAVVLFTPFVIAVTLVHLPAVLAVIAATGAVRSTATKGTVRMLVGMVALLATWLTVGMMLADGPLALAVAAAVALAGAAVLASWSSFHRAARAVRGALRRRYRVELLDAASGARDALVELVVAVEGAT